MAALNKLQIGVFSRRTMDYEPNTFFGGIGDEINTPSLMAAKLINVSASNIKNFSVDSDNNVSFYINKNWKIASGAFENSLKLKFIISQNNKLQNIGGTDNIVYSTILGASNCKFVLSRAINTIGRQAIQNSGLKLLYYPNCTFIGPRGFTGLKSFIAYLPNTTVIESITEFTNDYSGCKAYLNPYLATVNEGNVHPGVQDFINKGGVVQWVYDLTPPDTIVDLSISLTDMFVIANFTTPSSVNPLDFFELWLEEIGVNDILQKSVPQKERIKQTGDILPLLKPDTDYKLRLATCDVYYNGSGLSETPAFSNEVFFKTPVNLLPKPISYWKNNGDANDAIGSNNGVNTDITYVSGKVGQAANFNGTTSEMKINSHPSLSFLDNKFSISLWFNLDTVASDMIFFRKRNASFVEYVFDYVNGELRFWLFGGVTSTRLQLSKPYSISTSTWYHVSITFDGLDLKLYINGVNEPISQTNIGGFTKTTFTPAELVFGINFTTPYRNYQGKMDEIIFFDEALTPAQVTTIYNKGNAGIPLI